MRRRTPTWSAAGAAVVLTLACTACAPAPYDLLVRGGRIIDGSGNPWFCELTHAVRRSRRDRRALAYEKAARGPAREAVNWRREQWYMAALPRRSSTAARCDEAAGQDAGRIDGIGRISPGPGGAAGAGPRAIFPPRA